MEEQVMGEKWNRIIEERIDYGEIGNRNGEIRVAI